MNSIIIDFMNIFHMSWHKFYKSCLNEGFGIDVVENNVRSDIIEKILYYSKENDSNFADTIIALEGGSWRKKVFPYYKVNRKKDPAMIDLIEFSNKLINELEEIFPFCFLQRKYCEGDDIIATISKFKHIDDTLVIISRDHDFLQLVGNRVFLYNPFKKKYITSEKIYQHSTKKDIFTEWKLLTKEDSKRYRKFHILYGDSGDGIPNIMSDDDVFVNPTKKQKAFGPKTILKNYFTDDEEKNEYNFKKLYQEQEMNFKRNMRLIDLNNIPKQLSEDVMDQYRSHQKRSLNKSLFEKWCMKYELQILMEKFTNF